MRSKTYVCPSCKNTTTLTADTYESTREFEQDLPDDMPCFFCDDRMTP